MCDAHDGYYKASNVHVCKWVTDSRTIENSTEALVDWKSETYEV